MGKDVIVVLLFWTIKKLAEGKIDQIDFPRSMPPRRKIVARLLKEKKVPTISEMFRRGQAVGQFRMIACSAGLEYMGVDSEAAVEATWTKSWASLRFSRLTANAETKLFI